MNQKTPGNQGVDPGDGAVLEEDATRADGSPSEDGHKLDHIDTPDVVGVAELVEVVPVPAGEMEGGNTADADASRFVEIPEDGHNQEAVPAADHVQGSRPSTPGDDDKANEVGAGGGEAVPSAAEIEPYARSEDNLATKLPNDDRDSEGPTTGHVESLEAPLAPQDEGQPLDMLDGVATKENDQDAGAKNEPFVEVPNEPRYREVLMAEHVEGFVASLERHDGGTPRDAPDGPVAATFEREQGPGSEEFELY